MSTKVGVEVYLLQVAVITLLVINLLGHQSVLSEPSNTTLSTSIKTKKLIYIQKTCSIPVLLSISTVLFHSKAIPIEIVYHIKVFMV